MTATVEDDFREFVVARWPELESVARVVVLDPGLARSTTTDALTRLRRRWPEAVEGGRPGDAARRGVLTAAVDAASRTGGAGPPSSSPSAAAPARSGSAPEPPAVPWEDDAPHDDPVVQALVAAARSAPPLERVVLATATLWDCAPDEVARLLDVSPGTVHEHAASLRSRLATAHDAARIASGLEPSSWARDQDVTAAVDVLLRGLTDPPDPAALVADRGRGLRRRTLVAGGAAVVALVGVGAVLARRGTRPSTVPAGGPGAPASLAPDDPRWASTAEWPARGPLAGDPGLASLLSGGARRGDHVLWAGDLGTRRVVVAWTRPSDSDGDGNGVAMGMGASETFVRVFDGPSGTDPTRLREAELPFALMMGAGDVVAVTLPDGASEEGDRSLLVVLARPTVSSASVSHLVHPTPDGRLDRSWSPLPLEAGVAAAALDRPVALAVRLRVGPWEGTPVMPTTAFDLLVNDPDPAVTPQWAEGPISALTGIPVDRLTTTVHADEEVPGGLFDGPFADPRAEPGRLVSLLTTTPDGAVLRTTAYRGGGSVTPLEPMLLLPAGRQDEPLVVQVWDLRPDVARFLVVAPGADRVQLISSSPDGYPVSKVHGTGGRDVTVVPVVNGARAGQYRLITRDRGGRVLFDGVPTTGRSLLDG
ncbi:MAG TPA: hypothetical protein VLQ78_04090 [Ornithinibacter sp.]|nr:hypothetical protein [Ornithinibacter sp.]